MLSRVTGLLRVLSIGAVLGPTYLANVFVTTNTVPNIVYAAVAGQVLAMVVVPVIVSCLGEGGRDATVVLLGRITGVVLMASAAVAVALVVLAPVLAWGLTIGVAESADPSRAFGLTVLMIGFVSPQVPLYCLAAICISAQQARGRFAVSAGAPALENIGLIVTMALVALWYPPGLEVDAAPIGMMAVLGIGSTVSVAVHAGVQMIGAARAGLPVRPSLGWRTDPQTMDVTRRIRNSIGVAAAPAAGLLLLFGVAATVAGGAVALQAAQAIYAVAVALGARSIASAMLPRLSAAYDRLDDTAFAASWRQTLYYVAMASAPAAVLLLAFAGPAGAVLANGQLRTEAFITTLSACIAAFGLAQFPGSLHEIGRQALFARIDVDSPRRAAIAGLAVTVVLGGASLLLPDGLPRMVALSMTVLVAEAVSAGYVLVQLRTALRPQRFTDHAQLRTVVRATGLIVPIAVAGSWLARSVPDRLGVIAIVAVSGLAAAAALAIMVRLERSAGVTE